MKIKEGSFKDKNQRLWWWLDVRLGRPFARHGFVAPGAEQTFECPGSGIIDFPPVFKEALDQGIEHFIVEHDTVKDGMACLKTSGAYMRNLTIK